MEPFIAVSARKHGVDDADMLHAYAQPLRVFAPDEGLTMLVGPARDARLLEVGVVSGREGPVIVHAMPARNTYLRNRRKRR